MRENKPKAKRPASPLPPLWTTDFILITCVMTLSRISTQIQTTAMPLFFQYLGGNKTVAGLSMTFFTMAALLCRPFIGVLLDRYGRMPVLITGLLFYTLSTFAYGFLSVIPILIILRIIHGASFSASSTSSSTIVADVVPESRMTQGLAYFGMFGTLSIAVAPSLTLYLIDHTDFAVLFSITAAISFVALLTSLGIQSEKKRALRTPSAAESPVKTSFIDSFFERKALPPALMMLFVSLATSSVTVFLPTYAIFADIPNIGLFYVIQAAALASSSFLAGRIYAKVDPNLVIKISLLTLTGSIALIFFTQTLWGVLLCALFYGFSSGLLMPRLNAMAVLSTTPDRRGKASAMYYLALDFGIGTGAALWGMISDLFSVRWIFPIAGCLPLIALWVGSLSSKKSKSPQTTGDISV